jgi:hypothetical protein
MSYHPVNKELPATQYPNVAYWSLEQIQLSLSSILTLEKLEGSELRALKRPLDMDRVPKTAIEGLILLIIIRCLLFTCINVVIFPGSAFMTCHHASHLPQHGYKIAG